MCFLLNNRLVELCFGCSFRLSMFTCVYAYYATQTYNLSRLQSSASVCSVLLLIYVLQNLIMDQEYFELPGP
jgi:hypothetical protein